MDDRKKINNFFRVDKVHPLSTIKKIDKDNLLEIAADQGFKTNLMLKDYNITAILYLLKDIRGIYFKGGTALQKIFLNYSRLSEDIDLSITKEMKEVRDEITSILKKCGFKITKDKDVEGFTRLIVHYKDGVIFIDINRRSKLLTKPTKHKINHFYKDNIPEFSFNTLSKEEMIAEKIAAAIGRNKPRDHYDIYRIIKEGIPINMKLVKQKCIKSGTEFSIIKMFNRAKKLKNRWNDDMIPLIKEEVPFVEVMQTLAKYFNLKKEKELMKDAI